MCNYSKVRHQCVMAPNVASGDASRNLGKFEVEIEDSKNMGYIVI